MKLLIDYFEKEKHRIKRTKKKAHLLNILGLSGAIPFLGPVADASIYEQVARLLEEDRKGTSANK